MAVSRDWIAILALAAALALASPSLVPAWAAETSAVLTLDASNFSATVAKHQFIVVEFYAPWCGHCQRLAPEYEKAASILSKHDPPIILAKVNAIAKVNQELASSYNIVGYPTIKILRKEGKRIQEYSGPREADGIDEYLRKLVSPASVEIKSAEDVIRLLKGNIIFIVGVFPEFSGVEYENFVDVAENMRSDYGFGHTLDAKVLPHGDSEANKPLIRLFRPFDEPFVDFRDFNSDAMQSFIENASLPTSLPTVTTLDEDPANHPFLKKIFGSPNAKAMLYLNFSDADFDIFKSKYLEVAEQYKRENISFLIGDVDANQNAMEYYGLKENQIPLILVQDDDGEKYLKSHVAADQIAIWLKKFMDGSLKPLRKSQPIPEANDELVKTVVADSLEDVVFQSGKNVLLEIYAPWCGYCKKLVPVLDEVAKSFKNDPGVIIAKMDATANDIPRDLDIQGYPTLYFFTTSGQIVDYGGHRTVADIIDFVQKFRDSSVQPDPIQPGYVKDEL